MNQEQPYSFEHVKIKQFPPTAKGTDLGTYGWGFETKDFRIVVYGPPEADTHEVKQFSKTSASNDNHRRKKIRRNLDVAHEIPEDTTLKKPNRNELNEPVREKPEMQKQLHHADHPPAHVHVIQLRSEKTAIPRRGKGGKEVYDTINKENRYELIEGADGKYSAILMAPRVEEDGSMSRSARENLRLMIDRKHDPEIQKLLGAMAPRLVECWRKLYSPESYTIEQIRNNPVLGAGYDRYVSEKVGIETPSGTQHTFIRRLEGDDKVSYTKPDGEKQRLRVIFPTEDDDTSRSR